MTSEHENTRQNGKSGQKVAKHKTGLATGKKHPKTSVLYWAGAVYFPVTTRGGQTIVGGEYYARIKHVGRREAFPLGTSNKDAAASKAKEIYLSLQASGWEPTLAKYKPKAITSTTTVGAFLDAVKGTASGRIKTIEGYARAFRQIVADIAGIDGGREKYDYRSGGRDRWLKKVHAVKMASITPAKVQAWKIAFLKRAGDNPVDQRASRVSVNSIIRQAKSLFTPAILEFVKLDLEVLPFAGVKFEPRQSMRYRATFDVAEVIRLALDGDEARKIAALPDQQRKIFLLAVMAGLRRGEIDTLEWSAFRWNQGIIRIEATRYFKPKSEDSAGDVEIDPELLALFRGFHAKGKSNFVVESNVVPRPGASYWHYRCQKDIEGLTAWLRKAGVTGVKPLHTLRKEYGSQMCAKHGIYAASHALRHGDIAITSQHYLDSRKRVTVGLGGLLTVPKNVTAMPNAETRDKAEPKKSACHGN